jgi:DNA topoisomerase-1
VATTLIVTEKPDAALHVAEALSPDRKPKKISVGGVPFFDVRKEKEHILVCSALGHLYAVGAKGSEVRSQYPVWDIAWKPRHLIERGQGRQEKWIQSIAKVAKEADRFMNGCDYDVEGSLIGYTILKYACNGAHKKARRMKFSTLLAKDLQDAYSTAAAELDFPLAYAGMCRHEVDWLYGINLSRALTQSAYKASSRYSTLSTGRVQGPTLRFVVDRETEIETHVPVPYWVLRTTVEVNGQEVEADHEIERFEAKAQAESAVQDCAGKAGAIERLDSRTYRLLPPTPFDLSALQAEAYRHFFLTPRVTLGIGERLYLDQLISYPRTSSQKLPTSMDYREVLRSLGQIEAYRAATAELLSSGTLVPNEGRKDDPAHPAIYPTGTSPKRSLEPREQKIFDLIVHRFLATFGSTATRQSDRATIKVGQHTFFLHGSRTLEKGWISLYQPYAKLEDVRLPALREGQEVTIKKIGLEEKHTQPPPRFNPSSLLKAMENAEIGTKATRADIIETLYRRGYVKEQRMVATQVAFRVIEILTKFCPKVVDVAFTHELESMMHEIELGKQTREHVVLEAVDYLKPIIEALKNKEDEIGREITGVTTEMWQDSITLSVPCPKCGSKLRVIRNPRSRKRFIGCSGKWEEKCPFSLPLPQFGALTLLGKSCPECGFQMVQVRSIGRRPMISCPNCFVNKSKVRIAAEVAARSITEPSERSAL